MGTAPTCSKLKVWCITCLPQTQIFVILLSFLFSFHFVLSPLVRDMGLEPTWVILDRFWVYCVFHFRQSRVTVEGFEPSSFHHLLLKQAPVPFGYTAISAPSEIRTHRHLFLRQIGFPITFTDALGVPEGISCLTAAVFETVMCAISFVNDCYELC